jgi:hypothetical protein
MNAYAGLPRSSRSLKSRLMVWYFARDLAGIFVFFAVARFPSFQGSMVGWFVHPLVRHFPHQKLSLAGTTR